MDTGAGTDTGRRHWYGNILRNWTGVGKSKRGESTESGKLITEYSQREKTEGYTSGLFCMENHRDTSFSVYVSSMPRHGSRCNKFVKTHRILSFNQLISRISSQYHSFVEYHRYIIDF